MEEIRIREIQKKSGSKMLNVTTPFFGLSFNDTSNRNNKSQTRLGASASSFTKVSGSLAPDRSFKRGSSITERGGPIRDSAEQQ